MTPMLRNRAGGAINCPPDDANFFRVVICGFFWLGDFDGFREDEGPHPRIRLASPSETRGRSGTGKVAVRFQPD